MQDMEILNDILDLLKVGLDIAILTPVRLSVDEAAMDDMDIMTDDRVMEMLENNKIRTDQREAFIQQTTLGWTRIFMGYFTTGWRTSTDNLEHRWMPSCTQLFLEWGRDCWSHRNSILYGPPKHRHQQK